MTNLDLDAIEARAHEFCSVCDGSGTVSCWSPGGPCPEGQTVCETCGPCRQSDVPALVAALREARAEVDAWQSINLTTIHERDDWRRRYEALRDAVREATDYIPDDKHARDFVTGYVTATADVLTAIARVEES